MSRVYLDSCVVIYRVEGAEPYRSASDRALLSLGSADAYMMHTYCHLFDWNAS